MPGRPPRRIFVLTGAGISAESGLGTFRDRGGIWSRFDPMRPATPEAFAAGPDTVLDFYNLRRRGVIAASPNAAHRALACAEAVLAARGGVLTLCTQNVDDLHERGGSRAVLHMHGRAAQGPLHRLWGLLSMAPGHRGRRSRPALRRAPYPAAGCGVVR